MNIINYPLMDIFGAVVTAVLLLLWPLWGLFFIRSVLVNNWVRSARIQTDFHTHKFGFGITHMCAAPDRIIEIQWLWFHFRFTHTFY